MNTKQNVQHSINKHMAESRVSLTTISTRTNRIVRRTDNNYSQLRSKSKSRERHQPSFESYYIKHIKCVESSESRQEKQTPSPIPRKFRSSGSNASIHQGADRSQEGNECSQGRNSFTTPNSNGCREKKRDSTPVKCRKQLRKEEPSHQKNTNNFELELKVTELQAQLLMEKKARENLMISSKSSDKTVQHLKEILSQLEMENKILFSEKKGYEEKIETLEKTILESENTIAITQNNFNKLKQSIKENRLMELQAENKKFIRANQNLKATIKNLEKEKKILMEQLLACKQQNEEMQKKLKIQDFYRNQSMREEFLNKEVANLKKSLEMSKQSRQKMVEKKLQQIEAQLFQEVSTNKALKVKIHALEHNKLKQIGDLKSKQEAELKSLKVKYSKLITEMKQKQEKQRSSLVTQRSKIVLNKKKNPEKLKSDEFSLELSSDNQ